MSSGTSWVGGEHVKAQQWGVGKTNSGEGAKKFGSASAKRHGHFRFNPNPTRVSHPSCQISRQAKIDKDNAANSPRVILYSDGGKFRREPHVA